MSEGKKSRRIINAWCMYDWASSAFAATIMAAMFPPFYRSLVTKAGLAESSATAYWGYTTSIALLVIALIAPVLGAIADHTGGKKRYLAFLAGLGILATAAFVFIGTDTWVLASLLFMGGNLGFAGANIFYESLLPHITTRRTIDQVSTRGYALGYLGAGVLLLVNVLWVMRPQTFGMPDATFALRASFLSVAVWWGAFSVPLFRHVPEPAGARAAASLLDPGRAASLLSPGRPTPRPNPVREGLSRLRATFRDVRRYRQLLTFLAAFWIYNDGIGTIIKMATAYGDEIGLGLTDMTVALVITQFVGIPCSVLFGALAGRIGAKQSILLALGVYAVVAIAGYFMETTTHFYILAFMVGTVQGGSQALSRSLFGAMVPRHKAAEFFGFFSTSAKFAGIAGPLLFGLVSQMVGHSRLSILSLIVFFVAGGALLARVDVEEGIRAARAAEETHA